MAAEIKSISLRGIDSPSTDWYSCSGCVAASNTVLQPDFAPSYGLQLGSGDVHLQQGSISIEPSSTRLVYVLNIGKIKSIDAGNTYQLEVKAGNETDIEQVQIFSYAAPVTPTPPASQPPSLDVLKQTALDLINKDRASAGLAPVTLSTNGAAQAQAEDIASTMQISHWMTSGEKPYMSFTRYGGKDYVEQNVALTCCFSAAQSIPLSATDVQTAVSNEEDGMVNGDLQCCNNGHRNNILDAHHTSVSIGIAHNNLGVVMVQNFENDYVSLSMPITTNGNSISLTGKYLPVASGYSIKAITVNYDPFPTHDVYLANAKRTSYDGGEQLRSVVKPAPPGYEYQQDLSHPIIEASNWSDDGSTFSVKFNMGAAEAEKGRGAYTLMVYLSNSESNQDLVPAVSYTILISG
jgi:hypothetical protein